MTIFQLPAAQHLERYGYRRFVLMGWAMRTVLILMVAAIPLANFLDDTLKACRIARRAFLFQLSCAASLPRRGCLGLAHLIPEEVRGRFLSIDQFFMYGGCLLSLLASALVMAGRSTRGSTHSSFLLARSGGSVSLGFIKRIPEVPAGEATSRSSQKVPWREILAYPPFRELLIFNLDLCDGAGKSWCFYGRVSS